MILAFINRMQFCSSSALDLWRRVIIVFTRGVSRLIVVIEKSCQQNVLSSSAGIIPASS